jgi:hypothetical protein
LFGKLALPHAERSQILSRFDSSWGPEETNMRTLLSTIIAIAVVTPALAADEFYIVRDATTKRCTIVNQRPTSSTTTIVGDGTVYTTREKADTAMRTAKICVEE